MVLLKKLERLGAHSNSLKKVKIFSIKEKERFDSSKYTAPRIYYRKARTAIKKFYCKWKK